LPVPRCCQNFSWAAFPGPFPHLSIKILSMETRFSGLRVVLRSDFGKRTAEALGKELWWSWRRKWKEGLAAKRLFPPTSLFRKSPFITLWFMHTFGLLLNCKRVSCLQIFRKGGLASKPVALPPNLWPCLRGMLWRKSSEHPFWLILEELPLKVKRSFEVCSSSFFFFLSLSRIASVFDSWGKKMIWHQASSWFHGDSSFASGRRSFPPGNETFPSTPCFLKTHFRNEWFSHTFVLLLNCKRVCCLQILKKGGLASKPVAFLPGKCSSSQTRYSILFPSNLKLHSSSLETLNFIPPPVKPLTSFLLQSKLKLLPPLVELQTSCLFPRNFFPPLFKTQTSSSSSRTSNFFLPSFKLLSSSLQTSFQLPSNFFPLPSKLLSSSLQNSNFFLLLSNFKFLSFSL